MDGKQFLKRALLIGLISALPAVVNGAPPGGGGHSSGGGGGHSGGGGGHFAGGGGGRAAIGGGGRAAIGGGGRPAFAGGGPAVIGNRSPTGMQANASTGRGVPVPVSNSRNFGNDPSGRGDWKHANGTAWHRHDNDDDNGEHETIIIIVFPSGSSHIGIRAGVITITGTLITHMVIPITITRITATIPAKMEQQTSRC